MKRLLVLAFLVLAVLGWAAPVTTPVTASPATILWDPITKLGDGSAIPAGDTIAYELYMQPCTSAGVATGTATLVATVTSGTGSLVLAAEGWYVVGVRTKRTLSGSGSVVFSDYAWSQVVGSPNPWFLAYNKAPSIPQNLRMQ